MRFSIGIALLVGQALASPHTLHQRQANNASCPPVHIFSARETTAPPGFGGAGKLIAQLTQASPGATKEAINYPACGGGASCGGVSYADSVKNGTNAVAQAVNDFNTKCPQTKLVLVGFSQGGQIMDNAYCGGGDKNQGVPDTGVLFSPQALPMIKAAIFMGNPRFINGLPYQVGTCKTQGFDPRPQGFICASTGDVIQSFCDSPDPFCCNGNDPTVHQQYPTVLATQIQQFVSAKLQ